MDLRTAMKRHDAAMKAISANLRETTRMQSKNEALVRKLTLRMRQQAHRQAKPFRLRRRFPQLSARKKTDAQRKKLHAEIRSLIAAIRRIVSRTPRKRSKGRS